MIAIFDVDSRAFQFHLYVYNGNKLPNDVQGCTTISDTLNCYSFEHVLQRGLARYKSPRIEIFVVNCRWRIVNFADTRGMNQAPNSCNCTPLSFFPAPGINSQLPAASEIRQWRDSFFKRFTNVSLLFCFVLLLDLRRRRETRGFQM